MHDIKAIRENPDGFDAALRLRGAGPIAADLIAVHDRLRAAVTAKQDAETRRNMASKDIGKAKAAGDDDRFEALRAEVATLKDVMEAEGAQEDAARAQLDDHLARLPNTPADGVPVGEDESANVEVRRHGEPQTYDFDVKDHVAVGEALGGMDFETAAAMSGSRFVILRGQLAKLERALAAFMLDLHASEHGYVETAPPFLVRDAALFGTGQLPKFEEDLFRTTGDHWLIPTSEVPLTNAAAGQIVDEATLPNRMTACTPCFRSEAGSAGRDTRGMIRLHQFMKVELVSLVAPQDGPDELERMTACAEEVLKRLELPYRVMLLSTGDMGFAAKKTYDLEVWLPSQDAYREISSCSWCGDFQARRMNARFRREGEKKPEFLHTLNGSGVAVGRALVAILENHQNADASVSVPDALRPYMGGLETLTPPAG